MTGSGRGDTQGPGLNQKKRGKTSGSDKTGRRAHLFSDDRYSFDQYARESRWCLAMIEEYKSGNQSACSTMQVGEETIPRGTAVNYGNCSKGIRNTFGFFKISSDCYFRVKNVQ